MYSSEPRISLLRGPLWVRSILTVVALACLAACQQQAARPKLEGIAILRFENLGADPSLDWMGRAFSEILAHELIGAPGLSVISSNRIHAAAIGFGGRPISAPGISAEREAAIAAGANQLGYGQYFVRNGMVQARLTLEDSLTGRMKSFNAGPLPASELVNVATYLIRQIAAGVKPYGTQKADVVRANMEAIEGIHPENQEQSLTEAIAADPDFMLSYRQLAQFKMQRHDADGARSLIQQALARTSAAGEIDRAQLELQSAILANDANARLQALEKLANAVPGDPVNWRDLAATANVLHRYPQAAAAFRKMIAIQPGDLNAWNQLGYAAAYAGDLPGAIDALQRYQQLSPKTPNPMDSTGDAYLIAGQLQKAEEYYLRTAQQFPQFLGGLDLLKAATAHLLTGDLAGANSIFEQYVKARADAKDPLVDYRKAQWLWLTGKRKEARAQMLTVAQGGEAGPVRDIPAHAYAELAMWNLMLGDRAAATPMVAKALAFATPSSATIAGLTQLIAQSPASVAEWEARATRIAPTAAQIPIRKLAMAMSLIFAREFAAARPVLQEMYDSGSPAADESLVVLLAWADAETGKTTEAAGLLKTNPPLGESGLTWSTYLYIPRILGLRGAVSHDDAAMKAFRQLSGDETTIWDR